MMSTHAQTGITPPSGRSAGRAPLPVLPEEHDALELPDAEREGEPLESGRVGVLRGRHRGPHDELEVGAVVELALRRRLRTEREPVARVRVPGAEAEADVAVVVREVTDHVLAVRHLRMAVLVVPGVPQPAYPYLLGSGTLTPDLRLA
jgi:hypothetical protein